MNSFGHNLFNSDKVFIYLLEKRNESNKRAIDKKIWDLFGNQYAIVFTDLCGFTKLSSEKGIIESVAKIYYMFKLLFPCVEKHNGILLSTVADSMLVIFKNLNNAVKCSIAMQQISCENEIELCVGVGYGKILKIGDADVFGAEVNIASKLGEDVANKDEILVSENVYKKIKNKYECEKIEDHYLLKH
jgi:class 3 adenylate cyclase